LVDAAFIALSIANAWSLSSSACACTSSAKQCGGPMPIATAVKTSTAIVVRIHRRADRMRGVRAPLLCAAKPLAQLDRVGLRRLPVALGSLLYLT